jgi:hypothetical protein
MRMRRPTREEDRFVQLLFEQENLPADRRLRHVQALRRLR